MEERKTANLIFGRTRHNQIYLPYAKKRPYFDAIAAGNVEAVRALAARNAGYPETAAAKCGSEAEAAVKMRSEAVTAANEMCLAAVQAGMLDMVAYDIRDGFTEKLGSAESSAEIYEIVHTMAGDYALKMSFVLKEKKLSPRLVKMMTYIEEHLSEKIELADIAEHVGISRTYASAVFKEELGITISEFILKERMLEAKRMLRDTVIPIGKIASQLSFCSQSYFTKNFTETEGMTPAEYRRRNG